VADIIAPGKIAKGVYDVSSLFTWFGNQWAVSSNQKKENLWW
jgi:hypothetical protein